MDNACIDIIYHLPMNAGKHMIERVETRHGLRQLSYMKELGMGLVGILSDTSDICPACRRAVDAG